MRAATWIGASILLGVAALAGAYWHNLHDTGTATKATALSEAINACDLIASKAAADLPEALPFQKLEKAARQSRVLGICMQDHGYEENPDWVKQAKTEASARAKAAQVSSDEAYETFRRQAMLVSELNRQSADAPLYWRLHAATAR